LTNQINEKFLFTFAEASAATLALHCLEKSGRLLAAKDNPRYRISTNSEETIQVFIT
jgi:hypothetical protein